MDVILKTVPGSIVVELHKTADMGIEANPLYCEETGRVVGVFWTVVIGKFLFSGTSPYKLTCRISYSALIDLFNVLKHRGLKWHQSKQ